MALTETSDNQFETDVLQSDKPVLVDFWAPWCGPCKAIGPMIEQIAEQMEGQVTFFKCNVDENPATPGKYGIKAIPTLLVFQNGKLADQITGMVARNRIEEALQKIVQGEAVAAPFKMG